MRPNEHSRGYLPTLDGWRALAIAGVLMAHSAPFPNWMHLHRYVQQKGPLGVNLFFAISGFLICSRLLGEEAARGSISIRNFYIRRAFRILPPALAFLLVLALLGAVHLIPFDTLSWFGALFFFRNYLHYFQGVSLETWFTSHFWSLSIEEHFYFILPAVMALLPRSRKAVLIALAAASSLWLAWFLYVPPSGYTIPFWYQRTEFALPWLMVPALYAIWLESPRVRSAVVRYLTVPVGVLCGLVATQLNSMGVPHPLLQIQSLSLSFLYPALLLSTVFHPRHWFSRLLEWEPLRFIGRLSYSLYLWQELFLTDGRPYPGPIHFLQTPAASLVCTFACALLSYYLVERPMIRLGQKLTHQRNAVPARQPIPPVAEPV